MSKKPSTPSEPKITRRKISDYIPDDNNANLGTERGLQMIEDSLHQVGVGRSIVADKNGKIPAGNKTIEAAVNAGFEDVLEIEDDGKTLIVHKRADWDLNDPVGAARQYAYFDNRTSEVGLSWDANKIVGDMAKGLELGGSFYSWELDAIVGRLPETPNDPASLWQGMPEFNQPDGSAYRTLIVHIATEADLKKFIELTGCNVTDKTRSTHYPRLNPEELRWGQTVDGELDEPQEQDEE